jgi:pimeloyl-ACP methyl ester carboxylesterase
VNGLCWVLLGLVGLTLLLHLLARMLRMPVASRVFAEMPWLPAGWCWPSAEGETVRFATEDGVALEGTYLPTPSVRRKGVIAFCHELNGDRWSALPYTADLRRRGFDVLTFEFRNHGGSQRMRGYEPMPWVTAYEVHDVRAAINYLCSRADADPRGVGLMGISRGGTAALCAAAQDPRVRMLAIDGPVPTEQMQRHWTRRRLTSCFHLVRFWAMMPDAVLRLLGAAAKCFIGWRCRVPLINVDDAARRVRQPVLLIHGQCDDHVPMEVVRALRRTISGRTWLWLVPHARHNCAIATAPEEYQRRLVRFFKRAIAGSFHVDDAHPGGSAAGTAPRDGLWAAGRSAGGAWTHGTGRPEAAVEPAATPERPLPLSAR